MKFGIGFDAAFLYCSCGFDAGFLHGSSYFDVNGILPLETILL